MRKKKRTRVPGILHCYCCCSDITHRQNLLVVRGLKIGSNNSGGERKNRLEITDETIKMKKIATSKFVLSNLLPVYLGRSIDYTRYVVGLENK